MKCSKIKNKMDKTEVGSNKSVDPVIAFLFVVLLIIILYLIISMCNNYSKGPPGPPGPVTLIPTITLPVPPIENTNPLIFYVESTRLIVPLPDYPVIKNDLPNDTGSFIVDINVTLVNNGTVITRCFLYQAYDLIAATKYIRILTTLSNSTDTIKDSDWLLVPAAE